MATTANTDDSNLHQQSNNDLSKPTALHAVFGFIIGLLVALLGLKYLGSGTNPFIDHPWTMSLFISVVFVYTIAMLAEITTAGADDNTSNLFSYMYLISGSLACELLGFVLVGPLGLLLMNPSAFLLVLLLRRFNLQSQTSKQQIATTAQQQITDSTPQEVPQVAEVQISIQSPRFNDTSSSAAHANLENGVVTDDHPLPKLTEVVLDLDKTPVCAYETSSVPAIVRTQAADAGLKCFEIECVSSDKGADDGSTANQRVSKGEAEEYQSMKPQQYF